MSDNEEFVVKAEPSGSRPAKQGARPAADDHASASPKGRKRARKDVPPAQEDPEDTPEQQDDEEQPEQEDDDDDDDDEGSTPLIRDPRDGYAPTRLLYDRDSRVAPTDTSQARSSASNSRTF